MRMNQAVVRQNKAVPHRSWLALGGIALALSLVTSLAAAPAAASMPAASSGFATATTASSSAASYGKLPLRFEPNLGQAPASVQYLARAGGYGLGLTCNGALLRFTANKNAQPAQLSLSWVQARRSLSLRPEQPQPSHSNYFIGKDASGWHRGVANYGAVRYEQLYPGIDWLVYGNPQQLEYDLVLAPQADPRQIRLRIGGVRRLELDAQGDLLLQTGQGTLRQLKPVVYQLAADGARQAVEARYLLNRRREISFALGAYDHSRPLVIDPVLAYSTYLGGSADDYAEAIAVDGKGSAYVTGYTTSSDFPTTASLQPKSGGGSAPDTVCACDAFVAKLNADGSALEYATYLGGSGDDYAQAIALDSGGAAYVAGYTGSTDFPTSHAEQSANAGGADAFVAKLSADGSTLVYSSYLGGSQADIAQAIAVDDSGSAYVAGYTFSTDFPTVPAASGLLGLGSSGPSPAQAANGGGYDAFISKFSADGTALSYSTYLGGSGDDYAYAVAVDGSGSAYVTGDTTSTDFPTASPLQAANADNYDTFVAKLSADGTALAYSTYLGGFENDHARAIAVDSAGSAYLAGYTVSTNFPTAAPVQKANAGQYDAYVSKLSTKGNSLVYSTYLGGSGDDYATAIAVDGSGNAYVAGYTASGDFPTVSPSQAAYAGGNYDAFVAEIGAGGSPLAWSTYLGGSGDDYGYGVAMDGSGNAYVAGYTTSTDFPAAAPLQKASAGGNDAFVTKLGPGTSTEGNPGSSAGGGSGSSGGGAGSPLFLAFGGLAALARRRLRRG
jgi:hypothetical protein